MHSFRKEIALSRRDLFWPLRSPFFDSFRQHSISVFEKKWKAGSPFLLRSCSLSTLSSPSSTTTKMTTTQRFALRQRELLRQSFLPFLFSLRFLSRHGTPSSKSFAAMAQTRPYSDGLPKALEQPRRDHLHSEIEALERLLSDKGSSLRDGGSAVLRSSLKLAEELNRLNDGFDERLDRLLERAKPLEEKVFSSFRRVAREVELSDRVEPYLKSLRSAVDTASALSLRLHSSRRISSKTEEEVRDLLGKELEYLRSIADFYSLDHSLKTLRPLLLLTQKIKEEGKGGGNGERREKENGSGKGEGRGEGRKKGKGEEERNNGSLNGKSSTTDLGEGLKSELHVIDVGQLERRLDALEKLFGSSEERGELHNVEERTTKGRNSATEIVREVTKQKETEKGRFELRQQPTNDEVPLQSEREGDRSETAKRKEKKDEIGHVIVPSSIDALKEHPSFRADLEKAVKNGSFREALETLSVHANEKRLLEVELITHFRKGTFRLSKSYVEALTKRLSSHPAARLPSASGVLKVKDWQKVLKLPKAVEESAPFLQWKLLTSGFLSGKKTDVAPLFSSKSSVTSTPPSLSSSSSSSASSVDRSSASVVAARIGAVSVLSHALFASATEHFVEQSLLLLDHRDLDVFVENFLTIVGAEMTFFVGANFALESLSSYGRSRSFFPPLNSAGAKSSGIFAERSPFLSSIADRLPLLLHGVVLGLRVFDSKTARELEKAVWDTGVNILVPKLLCLVGKRLFLPGSLAFLSFITGGLSVSKYVLSPLIKNAQDVVHGHSLDRLLPWIDFDEEERKRRERKAKENVKTIESDGKEYSQNFEGVERQDESVDSGGASERDGKPLPNELLLFLLRRMGDQKEREDAIEFLQTVRTLSQELRNSEGRRIMDALIQTTQH